jgi:hypothetical protein
MGSEQSGKSRTIRGNLSDEGVAPSVQENFGETLRELRAAVADARDVLSTPALRARYQPI